jgi:hypothetical protein
MRKGLSLFVCDIEVSQITKSFDMLLVSLKSYSMSRGALSSFHNVLTYSGKVIEYCIKFSLKIHLN